MQKSQFKMCNFNELVNGFSVFSNNKHASKISQ